LLEAKVARMLTALIQDFYFRRFVLSLIFEVNHMIDKKAIGYHNLVIALDAAAMDAESAKLDEELCKAIRDLARKADELKEE
jgi:hypothetical protein